MFIGDIDFTRAARCGLERTVAVLVGTRWLPHHTACTSGVTSRLRYHITASPKVRVGAPLCYAVWPGTPELALLPPELKMKDWMPQCHLAREHHSSGSVKQVRLSTCGTVGPPPRADYILPPLEF